MIVLCTIEIIKQSNWVKLSFGFLALFLGWNEENVNVGEDTTWCNCGVVKKLVKFLIVTDSQLDVAGNNTGLLVVFCCITSKFEDLSSEIFENCSEVHWGTSTNTFWEATCLEETCNTTNWELETSLGWSWNWAGSAWLSFTSATFACHFDCCKFVFN